MCFIGDGLRVSFRRARDLMDRYNVNRAQTRRSDASKKSFKPHTPPPALSVYTFCNPLSVLSHSTHKPAARRHFCALCDERMRDVCSELLFKIGPVLRFEFPLKCTLWDHWHFFLLYTGTPYTTRRFARTRLKIAHIMLLFDHVYRWVLVSKMLNTFQQKELTDVLAFYANRKLNKSKLLFAILRPGLNKSDIIQTETLNSMCWLFKTIKIV